MRKPGDDLKIGLVTIPNDFQPSLRDPNRKGVCENQAQSSEAYGA
jgi:hypothetical protein